MTAQGMEVLIYKGERYNMTSLPLTSLSPLFWYSIKNISNISKFFKVYIF